MPVSLSYADAERTLAAAIALAKSDAKLPVEWRSHARAIFDLQAKTWTPAYATLLLAKATDDTIDTMSLKADKSNPKAYSARGLCHKLLVPAALKHEFSIRNTGREPLNNQPFFRYDRIDEIDRVRNSSDYDYFLDVTERANRLDRYAASQALAAFLREALTITSAAKKVVVKTSGLTADGARIAVEDFLRFDAPDRPHRLQAFAATCLGLLYGEVRSRRINDPSRDFPGDVHATVGDRVALAVEVRGKAVSVSDLMTFVNACESVGVNRAVMFVDGPQQVDLDLQVAVNGSFAQSMHVAVFTSAAQLLAESFLWAKSPLNETIVQFSQDFLVRLRAVEVGMPTLEEWSRAVSIAQGR